jgi:SAM-dependent methyltransferase
VVGRALRAVAGQLEWHALRVGRGRCPLCDGGFFVRFSTDLLGTRCLRCQASSISMAIGTVVAREVADLGEVRACELSTRGPFHAFLSRRVEQLASSEFFDGVAPGTVKDGVECQDVQQLTYADTSFDLVTSTEVFEHVPDDRRGFREIFRVLVPRGRFIFTVPLRDESTTLERAVIEDGEPRHLHPPTYHDDLIRGAGRVLVFRDYGRDITDRLAEAGFVDARIESVVDPAGFGVIARVVVGTKP